MHCNWNLIHRIQLAIAGTVAIAAMDAAAVVAATAAAACVVAAAAAAICMQLICQTRQREQQTASNFLRTHFN